MSKRFTAVLSLFFIFFLCSKCDHNHRVNINLPVNAVRNRQQSPDTSRVPVRKTQTKSQLQQIEIWQPKMSRVYRVFVKLRFEIPSDCWENCRKIIGDNFFPHPVQWKRRRYFKTHSPLCVRILRYTSSFHHSVNSSSHSLNGDIAIQWERSNFDPSQKSNPLDRLR